MTVTISGDENEDIEFEVRGKIMLRLTRAGLRYKGRIVKDGGKALDLMTRFLGLAEDQIEEEAQRARPVVKHEHVVAPVPSQQQRLDALKDQKNAMMIIQCSDTGEDDSQWASRMEADVPEWVKEADCMSDLLGGTKVQGGENCLWWRAIHVAPADRHVN